MYQQPLIQIFPFGMVPHAYLIYYLGSSATAPTVLQISSKKAEKLISGGPDKSGKVGKFFEKISRGHLFGT